MKIRTRRLPLMAILLAVASVAGAHTSLVASVPADKSTVAPLEKIELRFADTVQIAALTLQRGNAAATPVAPLPVERGSRFSVALKAQEAGDYVLSWSATTDDGHVASGKVQFTVAPAPSSAHEHQH